MAVEMAFTTFVCPSDLAAGTHPFGYLLDIAGAHRPLRLDPRLRIDQPRRTVAADFQDVLEPLGDQQPYPEPLFSNIALVAMVVP